MRADSEILADLVKALSGTSGTAHTANGRDTNSRTADTPRQLET